MLQLITGKCTRLGMYKDSYVDLSREKERGVREREREESVVDRLSVLLWRWLSGCWHALGLMAFSGSCR